MLFAIWGACVIAVIGFAARDQARRADAIVVLGAAQYSGRPSPVLRARVDHAIDLWRRNLAPTIVFTGGTGRGDTTSEAVVSARYAERRGVPERAILLESAGRTTNQSIRAVAAMLHARNEQSVLLVSDPFHMFRLWILARKNGLDGAMSPTRTSPIGARAATRLGYIFSESIKAPLAFLIE